ncbi:hypothetical protein F5B22DRAFT_329078 [Xylaria bambusicola]|uniref:uncharacterized protein n=1 Tax=Xylaria bambusicola TaxID=326684 RepID=UPI0020085191|nr:uncharacterized protein F5B22DRAFT_329078 [Xylaria bambusicola]KAI0509424.1 hypothetical protein F5B22DRAFT_329078 [Xylaria bambusicola]
MVFALPASLAGGLTDREAIADALYRAVLAFDHADEALLLSAITPDISAQMPGSSAKGVVEFKAAVFDRVSKLDTTHFLSNVRVSIQSSATAQASCSALAQHVRPGKGFEPGPNKFTSGGMYLCDLVKVGELWKINNWSANITWVEGDPSVMAGQ